MAVIGIGYDDFCRMTIQETAAVFAAYREKHEADRRDAWERMRMQACIEIQPHLRKKITPRRLLPLPWDKAERKTETRTYTAAERKARRDEILKRLHGEKR